MGQKAHSMKQMKPSLLVFTKDDLQEKDFAKFYKIMASTTFLDTEDNHITLIKASHLGDVYSYEVSFLGGQTLELHLVNFNRWVAIYIQIFD